MKHDPEMTHEEYEEMQRGIEDERMLRRRIEDDDDTSRQVPRLYRETDDDELPGSDIPPRGELPSRPI